MHLRRQFVEMAKIGGVLVWLIGASAGVILTRNQPGDWMEMFVYSFIIPILVTSFFYGRLGGLLVALMASLVSGSLAIGEPEVMHAPIIQRIMFQIIFFNAVALVTSGLYEREKEAKTRYRGLFEGVPIGLYRTTPEGQILDVNTTLVQMLGYPDREALVGTNITDLYVRPEVRQQAQALMRQEIVRDFETRARRRDGTVIQVRNNWQAFHNDENQILYYQGAMEDISEQVRAEEKLAAIHLLGREMVLTTDTQRIANAAVETAYYMLGFGVCTLWLVDQDRSVLTCQALATDLPVSEIAPLPLDGERGITVAVARSGDPICLPDVATDRRYIPSAPGTHSELCVPLKVGNRVIGVLDAEREQLDAFTGADQRLFQTLADVAAVALENARLHQAVANQATFLEEQVARRTAELSSISEISQTLSSARELADLLEAVHQQVGRIFAPDNFYIASHEEESDEWEMLFDVDRGERRPSRRYKIGAGLTGYVLRQRLPVLLCNSQEYETFHKEKGIEFLGEPSKSWLGVPLVATDKLVGVMAIHSYEENVYCEQDLPLFGTIAVQAAIAIENARLYSRVQQQLADLQAANRLSQETAHQLAEANAELESFAYSISHDLRAPLRAIDGFSRILLQDHAPGLSPETARYLQMVHDNAQRMGQLIDDLLTFSRLSRQPLKGQTIALADLVHQALRDLRLEQEGRQIEISIGDLPDCRGDPALLKQVIVNLLSNAFKFTRGRDVAQIEVGHELSPDGNPIFFVRDNGVGFDMRYADKLFGVFQRLHNDRDYEGTGAGLAIVQRIVHRHGGRVWAEAEVDKGATFYFTLEGDPPHD